MNRAHALDRLANERFDVAIIGGGAAGLGAAVDAASRGYATALIEAEDFASGTSSRSTKLIHGGIRYLRDGRVHLISEALRERRVLLRNAPHLVKPLSFVVPVTRLAELPYYAAGIALYDLFARRSRIGSSALLSRRETAARLPMLNAQRISGGLLYWDGVFDDARFAIALARTAWDLGACVANRLLARALIRENDRVTGIEALDSESGETIAIRARCVVNAAGPFADAVRRLDDPAAPPLLVFSRGSHFVVDRKTFGETQSAMLIPKTRDGRVVFAVPWLGSVVIGTTEVPAVSPERNPQATAEEIGFLLATLNPYLREPLASGQIRAEFAGLRSLVDRTKQSSARRSREHTIDISRSGLVTIAGGKWTTYRIMARDAIDAAAHQAGLHFTPSRTATLLLHGADGSDDAEIAALQKERPELCAPLHEALPYTGAHAVYAIRSEMARTVEDVLERRTRIGFLNAAAARECAPAVAAILAQERGRA